MIELTREEIILHLAEIEETLEVRYHITAILELNDKRIIVKYYSGIASGEMIFPLKCFDIFYNWNTNEISDLIYRLFQTEILKRMYPGEIIT